MIRSRNISVPTLSSVRYVLVINYVKYYGVLNERCTNEISCSKQRFEYTVMFLHQPPNTPFARQPTDRRFCRGARDLDANVYATARGDAPRSAVDRSKRNSNQLDNTSTNQGPPRRSCTLPESRPRRSHQFPPTSKYSWKKHEAVRTNAVRTNHHHRNAAAYVGNDALLRGSLNIETTIIGIRRDSISQCVSQNRDVSYANAYKTLWSIPPIGNGPAQRRHSLVDKPRPTPSSSRNPVPTDGTPNPVSHIQSRNAINSVDVVHQKRRLRYVTPINRVNDVHTRRAFCRRVSVVSFIVHGR